MNYYRNYDSIKFYLIAGMKCVTMSIDIIRSSFQLDNVWIQVTNRSMDSSVAMTTSWRQTKRMCTSQMSDQFSSSKFLVTHYTVNISIPQITKQRHFEKYKVQIVKM